MVARINSGNLGDWGNIIEWPRRKIEKGDWSVAQYYSPGLVSALLEIKRNKKVSPYFEEKSLPALCRSFYDLFFIDKNLDDYKLSQSLTAYCSSSEKIRTTMFGKPDCVAQIKEGRKEQAERMLDNAGFILIPCGLRLTNARVVALWTPKPSIGGVYMPLASKDNINSSQAKALTVFLNSSFGILQLLSIRAGQMDFPNFPVAALKTILYPHSDLDLSSLIKIFDVTNKQEMQRICDSNKDPTRKKLDHTVAKLLGVNPKETDKWRELLSNEPIISRKHATERPKMQAKKLKTK